MKTPASDSNSLLLAIRNTNSKPMKTNTTSRTRTSARILTAGIGTGDVRIEHLTSSPEGSRFHLHLVLQKPK